MVEGRHQSPHGALAGGMLDRAGRGLRPLQQVGEGEHRVARHHPFGLAPSEAHLAARLASQHAGVRHAAGEHLGQEMGDHRLDLPALGLQGEILGFRRPQAHPGGRDRPQQVGTLLLRALELREEGARAGQRGVVGGGAVAVDRPHAEGARFALVADLFRTLGRLEGEGRDHGPGRHLTHVGEIGDDDRGRRKQQISHDGRAHQGQPAHQMEAQRLAEAPAERRPGRQRAIARRHQPFWSSAYARMISRTNRWRTTSVSCR